MGDYEDDIEYQDVFSDLERVTFGQLGMVGNRITDNEDLFAIKVDATARNINTIYQLTNDDIGYMIEKSKEMTYVEFKNAEAYVLGYVASNGGTRIDKPSVNIVFNKLLSSFPSISKEDVIRYARLWMNLVGNRA
jgi:hypothetical protein